MNIKPTIGRVVWYWPHVSDTLVSINDTEAFCAATIAYVWNEGMVNLAVHDHNGNTMPKTSVPLWQGDDKDCPRGSCCWMPYQKEQAAKHHTAE